jgi:small-conductance mechanosensitive channel
MMLIEKWTDAFQRVLVAALDRIAVYLPNLLGALLVLALGWVVARIARALAVRAVMLLDVLLARLMPAGRGARSGERAGVAGSARTVGGIIFWVVMLLFVATAAQVLGLEALTDWLGGLLGYLPTLGAGVLIVIGGLLLGRLVRHVVAATPLRFELRNRDMLGRAAQITIVATAILVGADQVGVKVTFLVVLVGAVTLAVAGGIALAVSLGARDYVANLIGAHQLHKSFEVGQRIQMAGFEGRILDLTPVSVVLETAAGRVMLPARLCNEQPVVLLEEIQP